VAEGAGSARALPAVDLEKASNFLQKLSAAELHTVLRVLHIKGRMQANMADKRAVALSSMEDQRVGDEELESMMDAADLASLSTPAMASRAHTGARAPALSPSGGSTARAALSSPAAPGPVVRGPAFSANDMARLSHVATDPRHFEAVQADNQPLARTELAKPRGSLWETVLCPAFNNPDYKPARATPVDGVLMSDLRGMDPSSITCSRDTSKLETIYRALRSNYTKAYSNYTRSGQLEGGIFKDYVNGDHQLLHLHCLLHDNPAVDFVLRSLPQAAQAEVGLPGSGAVGRGPGHPGSAPPSSSRKRVRQAEVTIGRMENLTAALLSLGNSDGSNGRDAAGRRSADAFDNAEAMGAVWTQLKAARAAVAEDSTDALAISMSAHFEQQLENLMKTV